jgi:hypothetical protein
MKYMKTLGLLVMASTTLIATGGSASATTLTSPPGTTYTKNLVAEASNLVLTQPFGLGTLICSSSKFEGTVEQHGPSATAVVKLTLLTLNACGGGEFTNPVARPGSLEIHGNSTTGNGTVTWLNAEMVMHKTVVGTCRFFTSSSGTDAGTLTGSNITGGNATLDLSLSVQGDCGNGLWEGKYKVITPGALEVH